MSGRSFKFIHASDFHLDFPLSGVVEIPEHLTDEFLDAPLKASMRVFDAAISEKVDFVILAGHVLDLRRSDACAVDHLYRQFQRMHEAGISVIWCGTPADNASEWPLAVPLPKRTTVVASLGIEVVPIQRGDTLLCQVAVSAAGQGPELFRRELVGGGKSPVLAVAHGEIGSSIPLALMDVTYWAVGGRHARQEIEGMRGRGSFCGTPQGRNPHEEGPHGCTLIEVDAARQIRERFIPTDVVRWHTQRIEMPDDMDQGGLVRLLREKAERLAEGGSGRTILAQWILEDSDPSRDTRSDLLASRLRRGDLAGEILRILRHELSEARSTVWPLGISAEPPKVLPHGWYEEDTILGDLLRTVQQYQADPGLPIDFAIPRTLEKLSDRIAAAVSANDPAARERLLRQIAVLGVDLLRGDRVLTAEG